MIISNEREIRRLLRHRIDTSRFCLSIVQVMWESACVVKLLTSIVYNRSIFHVIFSLRNVYPYPINCIMPNKGYSALMVNELTLYDSAFFTVAPYM